MKPGPANPCDYCFAPAGEWCRGKIGPSTRLHAVRTSAGPHTRQAAAAPWTPEEYARMVALFGAGQTTEQVSAALGRTPSAVGVKCAAHGTSPSRLGAPHKQKRPC